MSSNSRLTRFFFLVRRWLLPIFIRISFPDLVYLKRLAVALCVFIFGNGSLLTRVVTKS